jgi:hypothetical protein
MNTKLTAAQHERLATIKDEMIDLLNEAYHLCRGTSERERAKAYWYGTIISALTDDHEYLGGCMCTLESTIEALDPDSDIDE